MKIKICREREARERHGREHPEKRKPHGPSLGFYPSQKQKERENPELKENANCWMPDYGNVSSLMLDVHVWLKYLLCM